MTSYKIPEQVLQGVVNYLTSRPFIEVAEMIRFLTSLEKITTDAKVSVQEPTR